MHDILYFYNKVSRENVLKKILRETTFIVLWWLYPKKYLHVSGPMRFKLLFEGQLYFLLSSYVKERPN